MAFRLTTATAVAHGAWNIYILQPEWMQEKGLFDAERPVVVHTLKAGPGVRLTTRGKRSPVWTATPFSMRVEFEKPAIGEDVGAPLAKLIQALPETPLGPVGYEMTYRGAAGEDMAVVPRPPAWGEPPDEYGASLQVKRDGMTYHLFLSRPADGDAAQLFVLCNRPWAGTALPAYSQCEAEVRRIAAEYWQVKFQ